VPLTSDEIAFLGPTVAEYSDLENGPAWKCLDRRGIRYDDFIWLMEAYKFVDPPCVETLHAAGGNSTEVFRLGRKVHPLPPCPWPNAEVARQRNRDMEVEVEALRRGPTS
jgi:hypothetical protein